MLVGLIFEQIELAEQEGHESGQYADTIVAHNVVIRQTFGKTAICSSMDCRQSSRSFAALATAKAIKEPVIKYQRKRRCSGFVACSDKSA